jgi:DNA-binding SARP family transcriptional activator
MNTLLTILRSGCILWLLTGPLAAQDTEAAYGLLLPGNDTPENLRGALHLQAPGQEGFTLGRRLDLRFLQRGERPRRKYFGYVVRLIADEDHHIDLVECTRKQDCGEFNLVVGTPDGMRTYPLSGVERSAGWREFHLTLDRASGTVAVTRAGRELLRSSYAFPEDLDWKIAFGACAIGRYSTHDVPPFSVRDVRIDRDGESTNYWPLDESEGTSATDLIDGRIATMSHASWLRPRHERWDSLSAFTASAPYLAASDPTTNRIFFLGSDTLLTYRLSGDRRETAVLASGPVLRHSDAATFVREMHEIIVPHLDARGALRLQPWNGEWSARPELPARPVAYLHHAQVHYPADSSIYFFGGYGQHTYRADVLRMRVTDGTFDTVSLSGDPRTPRYLSAAGVAGDTVYLLGGYGADDGDQLHAPRHYYDLYSFHPPTGRLTRKFSYEAPLPRAVFARSLVIDTVDRSYYALAFASHAYRGALHLVRGSLDRPEQEFMADSIPFSFEDTRSVADLFFYPRQRKLVAFSTVDGPEGREHRLHAIAYPPNRRPTADPRVSEGDGSWIWLVGLAGIGILALVGAYTRRQSRGESKTPTESRSVAATAAGTAERAFSLRTFGSFRIIDKRGVDRTAALSPLLKELFLLILFHSTEGNEGVTSRKLSDELWPGKTDRQAKNNRSVNLTKLRNLFGDELPLRVERSEGRYRIAFLGNSESRWDYARFRALTQVPAEDAADRLVRIVGGKSLLPAADYSWLDEIKADTGRCILAILTPALSRLDVDTEAERVLAYTATLLAQDPTDERAVGLRCAVLLSRGDRLAARTAFRKFREEYHLLLGDSYEGDLGSLIREEAR